MPMPVPLDPADSHRRAFGEPVIKPCSCEQEDPRTWTTCVIHGLPKEPIGGGFIPSEPDAAQARRDIEGLVGLVSSLIKRIERLEQLAGLEPSERAPEPLDMLAMDLAEHIRSSLVAEGLSKDNKALQRICEEASRAVYAVVPPWLETLES